jgi:4-hydroxybenzoate polyprenyltransferase
MNIRVLTTSVISLLSFLFYNNFFHLNLDWSHLILSFCLPALAYNFIIYLKPIRQGRLKSLKKSFIIFNSLLILLSLGASLDLNLYQIIFFILAGILTLIYDHYIKLRNFFILKPVSIALSWCLVLLGVLNIDLQSHLTFVSSLFMQILSLSILYDDKDYEQDKINQLATVRGKLSFEQTVLLSSILYCISIILFDSNMLIMISEIVLYGLAIYMIRTFKSPWSFILVLDSLIFIRPMLVVLFL